MSHRLRAFALPFSLALLSVAACGDDGGSAVDSGTVTPTQDASSSPDTGVTPVDSGVVADAGTQPDAMSSIDAGQPEDTGVQADAGMEMDAGMMADAGTAMDAGMMADAGICPEGYTGPNCDQCASGYVDNGGSCELDYPDETNLVLWLDADVQGSFGTTGANEIQSWADRRGGGGIFLTAPAAASRPHYVSNTLNGRAIARFDGTDDVLTVGGFTAFSGDDYTVFIVLDAGALGSQGILLAETGDPDWTISMAVGGVGGQISFTHRIPLVNDMDSVTGTSFGPGALNIVGVRRWTSSTLDYLRLMGWDNGVPNGIMDDDFNIQAGNIGYSLGLSLGVDKDNSAFNGDIAEVLIYDRALMDQEMQDVNRYLAAKWGKN